MGPTVETGPWWQSSGVHAVLGVDEADLDHDVAPGSHGAHGAHGADGGRGADGGHGTRLATRAVTRTTPGDLVAGREVWRVEAGRGRLAHDGPTRPEQPGQPGPAEAPDRPAGQGYGVFDLVFDWADGSWRLTRCLD